MNLKIIMLRTKQLNQKISTYYNFIYIKLPKYKLIHSNRKQVTNCLERELENREEGMRKLFEVISLFDCDDGSRVH
jgi:hypothetical protein